MQIERIPNFFLLCKRKYLQPTLKNELLILSLIWLLSFLFYSYLAIAVPGRRSFLSPDENNTFCVAEQLYKNHTLFIESPLNEKLNMKIFRGRLFVEARENKYTSWNSLGLSILVGLAMYLRLHFLVVPLLASLGVWGIYLIAKEISGSRAGLIASLTYNLLPTNIFLSNQLLDMVPSCALLLLSVGSLLVAMRNKSRTLSLISGVSLGLSFFLRQAMAVFILIMLIYFIINRNYLGKGQKWLFLSSSSLIFVITMLLNKHVYGSFYASGQAHEAETSFWRFIFPGYETRFIAHTVDLFIISYIPILGSLGLAGFISALKRPSRKKIRYLHIMLCLIAVIDLLIYAPRRGTWSFYQFSMSASMLRYFTPIFAVLCIYFSYFLISMLTKGKTITVALLIVAILSTSMAFSFTDLEGSCLLHLKRRSEVLTQAKQKLLAKYEQPIVVFTKRADKDLYNDVEVALCYTVDDVRKNPAVKRYPIIDLKSEALPAIERLMDENYLVLVASDVPELINILSESSFILERVNEYRSLYEVKKLK